MAVSTQGPSAEQAASDKQLNETQTTPPWPLLPQLHITSQQYYADIMQASFASR